MTLLTSFSDWRDGGMTITITFETENAAFEEDLKGEVTRILEHVSERVQKAVERFEHDAEGRGPLFDSNGNKTGRWELRP